MALQVNDKTIHTADQRERESVIAALQFSPVPSVIIACQDSQFVIITVNHSFQQLALAEPTAMLGKNLADLIQDSTIQHKKSLMSKIRHVYDTKEALSFELYRLAPGGGNAEEHHVDVWSCDIYPVAGRKDKPHLLVMHLSELKKANRSAGDQQEDKFLFQYKLDTEKEKYEDLFNLNPLPQFVYDLDTLEFLHVNEAAVQEYGYSKEEFQQMTLLDIRPEEDRQLLEEIISSRVIRGQLGNSTVRHMKKDGEIMHVNVQGNTVRYGDKNARLVVVVNLTEKLRTQKALENSERLFKALAQEGSDMIAIINPGGIYHYVNPNAEAIIGVPSEFFVGKNVFDFIHEDDKEMIVEHISLLMKHKRIQLPPFRFKIRHGEYRWIETVMTNMLDDDSVSGIITNSRDVTERINNDIKVREMIDRFNVLSKATSDAVWDWDMKDDKLNWNKGISGIFGYRVSETEDSWWQDRIHKEDVKAVLKKFQTTLKCKRSRLEVEYRFRCFDGSYKNVLDRMFITYNTRAEPIRMIGSMQDITERTNYTREIQEQNHRLQEISWLQSHGVRAPLARVIGLTNLLSSGLIDEGSSEESLRYLLQSATELDNVIRDIIKKTEGLQNKPY